MYDANRIIIIKLWSIHIVNAVDVARSMAKDAVWKPAAVEAIKDVRAELLKISNVTEKTQTKLVKAKKPSTIQNLEKENAAAVVARDALINHAASC
jgi:hypothetical protein